MDTRTWKERRKREALRKIAPGFEPQGTPLVPVKKISSTGTESADAQGDNNATASGTHNRTKSVMEDLVDQLAALES